MCESDNKSAIYGYFDRKCDERRSLFIETVKTSETAGEMTSWATGGSEEWVVTGPRCCVISKHGLCCEYTPVGNVHLRNCGCCWLTYSCTSSIYWTFFVLLILPCHLGCQLVCIQAKCTVLCNYLKGWQLSVIGIGALSYIDHMDLIMR